MAKKKKNFFDFWVNLIILTLFLGNIIALQVLWQNGITFEQIPVYYLYWVLFLEALVVIMLIQRLYIAPIKILNEHINDFITGKNKTEKIKIKTNYSNPNIKRVVKFFDVILNSLKNIKDEFLSGKSIKSEVQLATELQEKLLHKKLVKVPSLDIVAKSKPAWEIGWDSYDIIKQWDNFYIYVWDATWHWVWAGFVMVMVNALISWFSKVFKSGAHILAYTNEILKPRIKSNILMSLLMVRWNEKEKRLFMTWAWHEYLMIYKYSQKKCFMVKSWGLALWMTKNVHRILKEQEIKFEPNDIIVLYSDWITEAINQPTKDGSEIMYWEPRLVKTIEESPSIPWTDIKTAQSVFNNITIDFSRFWGYKNIQLDDITLVVAHYRWDKVIEDDFDKEISDDFITEWKWN